MRTNNCPRKISTTTQFTKTATRSTTRIRPNKWRCNPATAQINKIWDVRSNVRRWKTTKCRILCNISISDDSRGRFNILLIVILQNKERKKKQSDCWSSKELLLRSRQWNKRPIRNWTFLSLSSNAIYYHFILQELKEEAETKRKT